MPQVTYHTCDALREIPGVMHGFFERSGGISEGPFNSLNAARGGGDSDENVLENRRRAMQALGCQAAPLVFAKQEHATQVHVVDEPWAFHAPPVGDGLVTAQPHIALGVLTADCGPVLLADPACGVIGACHAGWRGALGGVIEQTVTQMEGLGAQPQSMIACLGPCIHQDFYEVDATFYKEVKEKNASFSIYFKKGNRTDHFLFDLPSFILGRLKALNINRITQILQDTYSGNFFSRRRSYHQQQDQYGCGLSVIVINSPKIV